LTNNSPRVLAGDVEKDATMLRMTIEGVGFDHLKKTVVLLKDWDNKKLLPIWIGAAEARAIALQLEGTIPPRPMAHDLLLNCIHLGGAHVVRIIINDLQDGTYYATIDLDTAGGIVHIDARPSDAIAVAVRARCPVFVDGNVENELIELSEEESENAEKTMARNDLSSREEPVGTSDNEDEETRFKRLLGDMDL
jgi:bifunctional DNase/RNase